MNNNYKNGIRDYCSVARGGVYELLNEYGDSTGKLYLVVSHNTYQQLSSGAIVCLIGEDLKTSEITEAYHVPFVMKQGTNNINMAIMTEIIFNVKQSRLCKYKFTLSDDIMTKVSEKVAKIMCGEELYTLNEAIIKLHEDEVDRRVKMCCSIATKEEKVEEETVDMSLVNIDDLGIEDSQALFAKSMRFEPVVMDSPVEKLKEEPKKVEIDLSKAIKKDKPKKKKTKTKKTKQIKGPRKFVYDKEFCEEFLLNYYIEDHVKLCEKYDCDNKALAKIAYSAKRKLIKLGCDMNEFNEIAENFRANTYKEGGSRFGKIGHGRKKESV